MTLARTALRLLVVEALTGDESSRPTIAQHRVYDSRISDLSPETVWDDALPTLIVSTDEDSGEALSAQNGGPPFRRSINVTIEMGLTICVPDESQGGRFLPATPDTDARAEASLDLLEFQVMRRLAYDLAPLPTLFRKMARIWKSECHRQTMDESGVKWASRALILACQTPDDQVSIFNAADAPPAGFDLLPEPLRSVAAAMPFGSSGADVVSGLIGDLTAINVPPFDGVDVAVDASEGREGVAPVELQINLYRT